MSDRAVTRAARLAALLYAQDLGLLDGLSLRDITEVLGLGNDRSTISRDLRDLPKARWIRDRLIDRLKSLAP